jgi:hypothetical protein
MGSTESMKVVRHPDARSFLDHGEPWLLRAEALHNEVLAVAHLLVRDDHPFRQPIYLATVDTAAGVAGCAVHPPPDRLTLTELPMGAVPPLVEDASHFCREVPGLAGPEPQATEFAELWTRRRGGAWHTAFRWRWYVADRIIQPARPAPGELRLAVESDLELVRAWAPPYAREIGTSVDVTGFLERRVRTASLYVWEHDGPQSLVAVSGLTPNGARISAVYTPPESRGYGYASAAVASVSRLLIDGGKQFCVLFTDLAHPTPNSIYQKIGYRPIGDVVAIDFSG